jgi:hypothetical protein
MTFLYGAQLVQDVALERHVAKDSAGRSYWSSRRLPDRRPRTANKIRARCTREWRQVRAIEHGMHDRASVLVGAGPWQARAEQLQARFEAVLARATRLDEAELDALERQDP